MNKIKRIFIGILTAVMFATSCVDDDQELGAVLDKSQIDFEVVQDFDASPGGNIVIMRNNTPGTVSMWDYGTGRSTKPTEQICFAFKGTYVIKFSALTAGGIVEMDPVTIEVTEDNLTCVDDPLWNLLSGGVGNEKTWLLDINAEGVSKYHPAPLGFAGLKWGFGNQCVVDPATTGDCWTWFPEYAGNEWMAAKADYGTMTFNLIGGPFVTVDQKATPNAGTKTGTYFLDKDAKTITFTDVTPLNQGWDQIYTTGYIIELTEDNMRLAFKHPTKAEYEVFNYISKEYSDNWVPEGPKEDPNFDHGDQQEIIAVSTSKTWKFDLQVPYNWTNLEGTMLNNWNSRADIMATGWAPYGDGDVENIDNSSITFYADGKVVVTQDNGTSAEGTYTLDEEKNLITFSGVTPTLPIASWVTATTTDSNQWKIVKVERSDLTDAVTGIWFGRRDPAKSEYMVFHFVIR
jgi:hypothetical protein